MLSVAGVSGGSPAVDVIADGTDNGTNGVTPSISVRGPLASIAPPFAGGDTAVPAIFNNAGPGSSAVDMFVTGMTTDGSWHNLHASTGDPIMVFVHPAGQFGARPIADTVGPYQPGQRVALHGTDCVGGTDAVQRWFSGATPIASGAQYMFSASAPGTYVVTYELECADGYGSAWPVTFVVSGHGSSMSPTPSASPTPTATPKQKAKKTPTPTPTATRTPTPTATPSTSGAATSPAPTSTVAPTATPTPTPAPTPSHRAHVHHHRKAKKRHRAAHSTIPVVSGELISNVVAITPQQFAAMSATPHPQAAALKVAGAHAAHRFRLPIAILLAVLVPVGLLAAGAWREHRSL